MKWNGMKQMLFGMLALILTSGCGGGMSSNDSASSPGSAPTLVSGRYEGESARSEPDYESIEIERYEPDYDSGYNEEAVYDEMDDSQGEVENQSKIIYTANVEMETAEIENTMAQIRQTVQDSGGYIASSGLRSYRRYGDRDYQRYTVTLRIPSERYRDVFQLVKTFGRVTSSGEFTEDVTAEYFDLDARLNTRRIEEERVLEMIGSAEKIEDLIALETRLGEIRLDIERYEGRMRNIDRLTSYSTIEMVIYEVDEEGILSVSEDFGSRLWQNFRLSVTGTLRFMEGTVLFLTGISIPVLLMALVFGLGYLLYRLTLGKKNKE